MLSFLGDSLENRVCSVERLCRDATGAVRLSRPIKGDAFELVAQEVQFLGAVAAWAEVNAPPEALPALLTLVCLPAIAARLGEEPWPRFAWVTKRGKRGPESNLQKAVSAALEYEDAFWTERVLGAPAPLGFPVQWQERLTDDQVSRDHGVRPRDILLPAVLPRENRRNARGSAPLHAIFKLQVAYGPKGGFQQDPTAWPAGQSQGACGVDRAVRIFLRVVRENLEAHGRIEGHPFLAPDGHVLVRPGTTAEWLHEVAIRLGGPLPVDHSVFGLQARLNVAWQSSALAAGYEGGVGSPTLAERSRAAGVLEVLAMQQGNKDQSEIEAHYLQHAAPKAADALREGTLGDIGGTGSALPRVLDRLGRLELRPVRAVAFRDDDGPTPQQEEVDEEPPDPEPHGEPSSAAMGANEPARKALLALKASVDRGDEATDVAARVRVALECLHHDHVVDLDSWRRLRSHISATAPRQLLDAVEEILFRDRLR